MHEYRTPDEEAKQEQTREHIRAVLSEVIESGASLFFMMETNEEPELVELWIDKLWNTLRHNLDGEERMQAILMLLEPTIRMRTHRLHRDFDPNELLSPYPSNDDDIDLDILEIDDNI